MFNLNQKGAAHFAVLLLILVGLGVGVYLIGQETNLFPKAYMPKVRKFSLMPISGPVSPKPTPIGTVIPSPTGIPNSNCSACDADIVKDARNRVDARDYAVMSSCFGKPINTVLPGGRACSDADLNKDGSINQTDSDCLKSMYFKTCDATSSPTPKPTLAPTSTPTSKPTSTPVPTPTPPLTVDKNTVFVTFKKSDAVNGVISGEGFTIISNTYWDIDYKNEYGTVFDYGFTPTYGGGTEKIKAFIKASLPNSNTGIGFSPYRGKATVRYYKPGPNGGPIPAATVNYVINLVD